MMETFKVMIFVFNLGLILTNDNACQQWRDVRDMYSTCFMRARQNFTEPPFSGSMVTTDYLRNYARAECRTLWPSLTSCMDNKLTELSCNNKADVMNVINQHQIMCDNGDLASWMNPVLTRFRSFSVRCFTSTDATRACMLPLLSWQPAADLQLTQAVTEIQGFVQGIISCTKQKLDTELTGPCIQQKKDVYTYIMIRRPFPSLSPGLYIPQADITNAWGS